MAVNNTERDPMFSMRRLEPKTSAMSRLEPETSAMSRPEPETSVMSRLEPGTSPKRGPKNLGLLH